VAKLIPKKFGKKWGEKEGRKKKISGQGVRKDTGLKRWKARSQKETLTSITPGVKSSGKPTKPRPKRGKQINR